MNCDVVYVLQERRLSEFKHPGFLGIPLNEFYIVTPDPEIGMGNDVPLAVVLDRVQCPDQFALLRMLAAFDDFAEL
jgi:hypothetical protein